MTVRTRIAPSPTGEYHIGHIRTVLYDYALAKKNNGQFIVRIEDTDQKRQISGAVEKILDVTRYLGITWNEGPDIGGPYVPYVQSQRLNLYKEYAEKLIEKGHAYHCFCSPERLNELREKQKKNGEVPKYDKKCLSLSKSEIKQKLANGESHVVRMNVPQGEKVVWHDEVYGEITVATNDIDDQVLIKSDGFPTYHFGVVIDDHLMKITHVLRGNDWLPSTPKHVLLYGFFGWPLPIYAHLPNLKEKDGTKKLSKRFGSTAAYEFLQQGYLPEALLNFLMFLGWNPGTDKEIFSLQEFIDEFDLKKIHKTDLVAVDREKLLWFNGNYIRNMPISELWNKILSWSQKFNVDLGVNANEKDKILQVLELVRGRMKLLSEFSVLTTYFFNDPTVSRDLLTEFAGHKTKDILEQFIELFTKVDESDWLVTNLDKLAHDFIAEKGYKPKEAFMTLRVAVSGATATPPIFDTLEVLGKFTALSRLNSASSLF